MHLHGAGWSLRRLSRDLSVSRNTVRDILREHHALTTEPSSQGLKKPVPRKSLLDSYHDRLRALLAEYKDARVQRLYEILKQEGYRGGYTILKDYVRKIRPQPVIEPVERFETAPGQQGQQDWSPYTLPFGRVHAFSYILGYSRRQYLEFTEHEDFFSLIRCHVRAFGHLGGVAWVNLYDNQKTVVTRWEAGQPIYNTRFLAFATHYGFRPKALPPRRPELKGKVERPFHFLETSFFNCRTFANFSELSDELTRWLAQRNDAREHRTTGRSPRDLHEEELPHLLPLPVHAYDTAQVVYRIADVEGLVSWDGHLYSVPPAYITKTLAVKVSETTLTVYSPAIEKIAEHELGKHDIERIHRLPEHKIPRETDRRGKCVEILVAAFLELGEAATEYLDGLKRTHPRELGHHLASILAFKRRYSADDIVLALEHALRFHAYDFRSIERILAMQARERTLEEPLPRAFREELSRWLAANPLEPRSLCTYQRLLENAGASQPRDRSEEPGDLQGHDSSPAQETQTEPHRRDPR